MSHELMPQCAHAIFLLQKIMKSSLKLVQNKHKFGILRKFLTVNKPPQNLATQHTMCEANMATLEDADGKLRLKPKKVVIVGKMTRLEFERQRYHDCSEEKFKRMLEIRGSNYDTLLKQHDRHRQTMEAIMEVLQRRGVECKTCVRGSGYTQDMVSWADAIITAGGDGTFLSAASKVKNQNIPVIGINTVPERSEGHLCLPRQYSSNFDLALDKLEKGEFRWLWRQRIRVTMSGIARNFRPINNSEVLRERMQRMNRRSINHEHHLYDALHYEQDLEAPVETQSEVLPVLALNEVFIGETLASVPSYYEIQVDDGPSEKQKSSGVCIATGTGSTAWSHNICRLHSDAIKSIITIADEYARAHLVNGNYTAQTTNGKGVSTELIKKVTDDFSASHVFGASDNRMLYSVRDPMENRVFKCSKCNGFAKTIAVRSRCWDASLCVDGDTSFEFNDGAFAELSIHPEDALRCVIIDDDANNNDSKL